MITVDVQARVEVSSEIPISGGATSAYASSVYFAEFCVLRPDVYQITVSGALVTDFGGAPERYEDWGNLDVEIRSIEPNEAFSQIYLGHTMYETGETNLDLVLPLESGRFHVLVQLGGLRLGQNPNLENSTETAEAYASLTIVPRTCPTDLNFDRRVDSTDLAILLSNLYGFGGRTHGNLTGGPFIDLEDLALLLAHYGEECTATTTP
ncbi:MAG: hypothetical protein ACKVS9_12105 [Phycisphaerae bacterium]